MLVEFKCIGVHTTSDILVDEVQASATTKCTSAMNVVGFECFFKSGLLWTGLF